MIKEREKFALISIHDVGHRLQKDTYTIAPNLQITTKQLIKIDELWIKWIGTIQSERLERSNLNILIRRDSDKPEIISSENENLTDLAGLCYNSLLLVAGFNCEFQPFIMSGAKTNGELQIQSIGTLEKPGIHNITPKFLIEEENIPEIAKVYSNLKNISDEKTHSKILRGIRSFISGINEFYAEDRIHQYVRCLESFIIPSKGKTAKEFKSKMELFIGPNYHQTIHEIYEIRSNIEHMHDPLKNLTHLNGKDVERLCMIAEGIARYCIKEVFLDSVKLNQFNDNNIEHFWNNSNKLERENIFENKFDLEQFILQIKKYEKYINP